MNRTTEKLKSASSGCIQEFAVQYKLGNKPDAAVFISYAVSYKFYEHFFNGVKRSIKELTDKTITDIIQESNFWLNDGLGKAIIHNNTPDNAFNLLNKAYDPKDENKLFWLGYFHAEHWDNTKALEIFDKLSKTSNDPAYLHWKGNLLSKLGMHNEALKPLHEAVKREPNRYNHLSHLGNVYRGLGMLKEAREAYQKAVELIHSKDVIGRVENIHLVRCYHGLSRLGLTEYQETEKTQEQIAIDSKRVQPHELERIRF